MAALHGDARTRPARPSGDPAVDRLVQVLGHTYLTAEDDVSHGLLWWYPQVKAWPAVRGSAGGGAGGKPGSALAINAAASDFISRRYWVGEQSQDDCSKAALDDDDNYRAGFEPTVLGLERGVRGRLGHARPPYYAPAAHTLKPSPAVLAALQYLLHFAPEIAADTMMSGTVRAEATRLLVRARGMLHGSRWSASRGPCPHCHQVESVISDDDRAFCDNPVCRTPYGDRYCWRFDHTEHMWVEVPEPDVDGRGQVTDEDLSRWSTAS